MPSPGALLVEKSEEGLLELCQSSRCRNDSASEPKRDAQTEAPVISDRDEFFDLINKPLTALSVAVEGMMYLLDVPSY